MLGCGVMVVEVVFLLCFLGSSILKRNCCGSRAGDSCCKSELPTKVEKDLPCKRRAVTVSLRL